MPKRSRPLLPLNATVKGDLTRLQELSPPPDAYVPPAAELSPVQLMEIERLAGQGFSLGQIGLRLEIEESAWEQLVQLNPGVRKAYSKGVMEVQDKASRVVKEWAVSGEDVNASWKWLERFGGAQYRPKPDTQVVIAPVIPMPADPGRIGLTLARQRALLDGQEIDGEATDQDAQNSPNAGRTDGSEVEGVED